MGWRRAAADGTLGGLNLPLTVALPLVAALLYAVGALAIKRASQFGIGIWRITFLANWAMALCLLPLALGAGGAPPGEWRWWEPVVTGLLFFAAQVLMFVGMTRGDVSVTTSVMGTKVVLVAVFSAALLPDPVPLRWWLAAGVSTAAVLLLSRGGAATRRRAWVSVGWTGAGAVIFALSDVLVQKWAPAWGAGRYLPVMFSVLAVASFAFVPLFQAPLREIPAAGRGWVLAGAVILAVQGSLVIHSIASHGDATVVNIAYSTRGLWSVVLVWTVGHLFLNEEQSLGRRVLLARLAGAALMVAAVGLVVG